MGNVTSSTEERNEDNILKENIVVTNNFEFKEEQNIAENNSKIESVQDMNENNQDNLDNINVIDNIDEDIKDNIKEATEEIKQNSNITDDINNIVTDSEVIISDVTNIKNIIVSDIKSIETDVKDIIDETIDIKKNILDIVTNHNNQNIHNIKEEICEIENIKQQQDCIINIDGNDNEEVGETGETEEAGEAGEADETEEDDIITEQPSMMKNNINDIISILNIIYYNYSSNKSSVFDEINRSFVNKFKLEINDELIEIANHVHNYTEELVRKYITKSNILEDINNNGIDNVIKNIKNIKNNNETNINIVTLPISVNKNFKAKINYYYNQISNCNINSFKSKEQLYEYLWLYYAYLSAQLEDQAQRASNYKNKNINSYYKYFTKAMSKLYRQTKDIIIKNKNKSVDELTDIITRYCTIKQCEVNNKVNNFNNIIPNH